MQGHALSLSVSWWLEYGILLGKADGVENHALLPDTVGGPRVALKADSTKLGHEAFLRGSSLRAGRKQVSLPRSGADGEKHGPCPPAT